MFDDRPITVPSTTQPSFWNRDTAVGFALLGPVGGIIGGIIGKNRLENERQNGREVAPPSFWNKSFIIGAGIGNAIGAAVGMLAVVALGPVAVPAGILGGVLIGSVLGGAAGKKRLENEYEEAKEFVLTQNAPAAAREQSTYSITPEMSQQLEHRLTQANARERAKPLDIVRKDADVGDMMKA